MSHHEPLIETELTPSDVVALCLDLERRRDAGLTTAANMPRSPALDALVAAARVAASRARAPYSGLSVGAALVDRRGRIVVGCNVENASYGLSQCAERSALCTARVHGAEDFAVLVVTSSAGAIPPCGACRQVIHELAPRGLVVAADADHLHIWRVPDLLPHAFDASGLPALQRH